METSRKFKRKFTWAALALLIALVAVGTSSFAWYIYNTNAHTTKLQMAAGSYSALLISDKEDGEYKFTIPLDSVVGELMPVSTNSMTKGLGFQIAEDMRPGKEGQAPFVAYLFGKAAQVNYFKRSLYLRAGGESLNVYIRKIGYTDSSEKNPISTAIRVGLAVYEPGKTEADEYIFAINPTGENVNAEYNTDTGHEGCVLDAFADKYGVTTENIKLYTPENYCEVDETTGETKLKEGISQKIATCPGGDKDMGAPVRVDVYIWLEGCDKDCVDTLGTLSDLSIEFTGFAE